MNTIKIINIDYNKHQIENDNEIKIIFIMKILKKRESFNLSDITYQFETKGEVVYTP